MAKQPEVIDTQVRTALKHYYEALEFLSADAVNDLSVTHNQLGVIFGGIGRLDSALHHYQKAIHILDESGDYYRAATTRYNVALTLLQAKRLPDALDYARAALRGYQHYGERAREEIDQTQALIDRIEGEG